MSGTVSGQLGRDIGRGVIRAVLVAGLLAFVAQDGTTTPPLSAAYFGVLMIPCTVIEARRSRSRVKTTSRTIGLTWAALVVALVLVHLQAAYTASVFTTSSFEGGLDGIGDELRRLGGRVPGEAGSLIGLREMNLFSLEVSVVATALTFAALAIPLARERDPTPSLRARAWAWLRILMVGLALASLLVTGLFEPHPAVLALVAWILLLQALPVCGVMLLCMTAGDAAARAAFGPEDDADPAVGEPARSDA